MKPMLVSLEIVNETQIVSKTGDVVTGRDFSVAGALRAHLILGASDDPELARLGFVHLRVEAQPQHLSAMTPEETRDWLCTALKRML